MDNCILYWYVLINCLLSLLLCVFALYLLRIDTLSAKATKIPDSARQLNR